MYYNLNYKIMENLRSYLLFIALFVILFSCKKDDDQTQTSIAKIKEIDHWINGSIVSSETYQYDSKGRIIREIEKAIINDSLTYTFNYMYYYSGSTITVKYGLNSDSMELLSSYILNSKGLVISVTNFNSGSNTYEYNSEGYLVKKISTSKSGETDSTLYDYQNGNIVSWTFAGSVSYTKTYQYLTNTTNTIDLENKGISFFGKQSKNLILNVITQYPDQTDTIAYTYEFDSKNRVEKQIKNSSTTSYITFTYTE
jgi:hypothetical protein